MARSYLTRALREHIGSILREVKVSLTPIPKPDKWVFIVGCYNSGTTLLAELLGTHPAVSALPTEGHFITDQFVKDYDIGLPRMWVKREELFRLTEHDAGPDVTRIKKEWGMRLDLSKPILVEKSPPNAARTRWLQRHFDNAHFIGLVRNGYAVAEGIARKADPRHRADGWPIEDAAHQWARSNELLLQDGTHLRHLLWVRYEDLTAQPLDTLNRIAAFLAIGPFDPPALAQDWAVHERREAIRDLNAESIARLAPAQIAAINAVAEPLLRHFGYEVLTCMDKRHPLAPAATPFTYGH